MFRKLAVIEPVNLTSSLKEELADYARDIQFYDTIPADDEEIIRRIGDADGVLVSYTTTIGRAVLEQCGSLKYIGMCCSLYAPENANVDITAAAELGITVTGVRDYGDEGVREYLISALASLLHGFGAVRWREEPHELTDLNVGVLGMGTTGILTARTLSYFGSKVHYYSRTRKHELEAAEGFEYLPLQELLKKVDILCCCLNKNVILMGEEEFNIFGEGKIFMNTSIGPAHEVDAMEKWLKGEGNFALSDTWAGLGYSEPVDLPNVLCPGLSAGVTSMAKTRLGLKVLQNMKEFLGNQ